MSHLLVIDDESLVREVVAKILMAAGHQVHQATNGHQALALLRTEPIDLVITDLVMPDCDGIELIMALRHQFPALPVIAMSGAIHNAALYLNIATNLGVRHTLAKPFGAEALLDAVDQTLERVTAV